MRILKIIAAVVAVLATIALVGAVALVGWRAKLQADVAGEMRIDAPEGVDTLETLNIGGIPQVVRIRGEDRRNPVLLYLHGGPGTPMMPFLHAFQRPLEKHFTVVQWDQRGSGKTAALSDQAVIKRSMTFARMEADALELTQLLRKRFNQQKIFVLGHSWGSMIGVPLVVHNPDLFHAYVGVGQVADVRESERRGYARDLLLAEKMGLQEAVDDLKAIAPYPRPAPWRGEGLETRHEWNAYFGESVFGYQDLTKAMAKIAWASPDYSLGDFWRLINGSDVYDPMDLVIHEYKAAAFGRRFGAPVVLIEGRYDYQVNVEVARTWFDTVEAPYKRFFYLEKAAHAPMVEDPRGFAAIMIEHVRPLADQPAALDASIQPGLRP